MCKFSWSQTRNFVFAIFKIKAAICRPFLTRHGCIFMDCTVCHNHRSKKKITRNGIKTNVRFNFNQRINFALNFLLLLSRSMWFIKIDFKDTIWKVLWLYLTHSIIDVNTFVLVYHTFVFCIHVCSVLNSKFAWALTIVISFLFVGVVYICYVSWW